MNGPSFLAEAKINKIEKRRSGSSELPEMPAGVRWSGTATNC